MLRSSGSVVRAVAAAAAAHAVFVLAAAAALVANAPARAQGEPSPPPPRPNIVLILADDMGYGDPGCYGSRLDTPHIDSLARDGWRFTDAHASGSWCVPSRYGLLTGRNPAREQALRPGREPGVDEGTPTLPGVLRAAGYTTGMVGKWHLGFEGGPVRDVAGRLRGGPVDRGFDRFFGIHASLDIPPYYYIRQDRAVAAPTEEVGASASDGWTSIQGAFWRAGRIAPGFEHADVLPRFEREAVAFVEEEATAEAPFFLYFALPAPHTPWLPLQEFRDSGSGEMYGDFVRQVDATVGAVLGALERAGVADDTLVVFTSDNGPVWYPADVERTGHRSVGPLRGMKSDAYEGGHRMPFVVRWPAAAPAGGAVVERTVVFTDLMATLAGIAGAELPAGAAPDSIDFGPLLRGEEPAVARTATVHKNDASVIREGDWKLITFLGSGGFSVPRRIEPEPDGPRAQLYDLASDPGETNNLWSRERTRAAVLAAKLDAWRRAVGRPGLAPELLEDPRGGAPERSGGEGGGQAMRPSPAGRQES